jgi:hypothetical protein
MIPSLSPSIRNMNMQKSHQISITSKKSQQKFRTSKISEQEQANPTQETSKNEKKYMS